MDTTEIKKDKHCINCVWYNPKTHVCKPYDNPPQKVEDHNGTWCVAFDSEYVDGYNRAKKRSQEINSRI